MSLLRQALPHEIPPHLRVNDPNFHLLPLEDYERQLLAAAEERNRPLTPVEGKRPTVNLSSIHFSPPGFLSPLFFFFFSALRRAFFIAGDNPFAILRTSTTYPSYPFPNMTFGLFFFWRFFLAPTLVRRFPIFQLLWNIVLIF